jgi:hypothetical protein
MSDDIYIGGGPGKHLKQPNPPVKPKWDTDPPEADEPSPDATMRAEPYVAPRVRGPMSVDPSQDATASPNISPTSPEDYTGMRGIKRFRYNK